MADDDDGDTGTDVSDVESTDSHSASANMASVNENQPFNSEQISQPGQKTGKKKHQYNRTGSMVIKHRTNSSLGNHLDLVNRMVSRWGSMEMDKETVQEAGLDTDSDYDDPEQDDGADDEKSPNNKKKAAKKGGGGAGGATGKAGGHRRQLSATDEMKVLQAEKEALEAAFDKYIDPDKNGDVDVDEWLLGLSKLDVTLSEPQQRKIYNFMDKDGGGFVEKSDFVQFATTRFDNPELLQLQKPILQAVRVQNLHDRTHSNLMNPQLSQDWTDYDLEILQNEMTTAMTGMVDQLKV